MRRRARGHARRDLVLRSARRVAVRFAIRTARRRPLPASRALPSMVDTKKGRSQMQHTKGFTLIELMVTVTVIAILAAIALPSYNDYVTRSKFAEATGNLADLRVKMEQYYADNRRYSTVAAGGICGIPGGNTPAAADSRYFTYTCASTNPNAMGDQQFLLTATGVAAQSL